MRLLAKLAIPIALAAGYMPAHGIELNEGDILVTLGSAVAHVDPVTGVRTILSASPPDFSPVGDGPALISITGIAVDCDGQIVVADQFADNLMRIDPATGDRVAVSGCADSSSAPGCPIIGAGPFTDGRPLAGIAVERDGNLLTSYIEFGLVVFRVNPVTGDRAIVSSDRVGDGPLPTSGGGVTLEQDGSILTWGFGPVRVNPLTGDRERVSLSPPFCNPGDCIGDGIDFWGVRQLDVAADGTILAAQDGTPGRAHGVVAIDPVTGDRSLVSGCVAAQNGNCVGETVGAGPTISEPFGLALEADGSAIVSDTGLAGLPQALFRVDPVSGDRAEISSGPTGLVAVVPPLAAVNGNARPQCGGPTFGHITGVTIVPGPPLVDDFLIVQVNGYLPCLNSTVNPIANVSRVDSQIYVDVFALGPDNACLTAILDFQVPGDIGLLPDGDYSVTARLTVDSVLADTFVTAFSLPLIADQDGDGVPDHNDNCAAAFNPGQIDTNGDGLGNGCDSDLNNDCWVNVRDLGALKAAWHSVTGDVNWNPDADFDADGVVNAVDLGVMKQQFFSDFTINNPSGIPNECAAN